MNIAWTRRWAWTAAAGLLFRSACAAGAETDGMAPPSLGGDWRWTLGSEELTLHLEQTGRRLSGWHTAIGQGGLKVDEVSRSDPPSITGKVDRETAVVQFRSGYPDAHGGGTAVLKIVDSRLSWHIVKSFGEHYLPRTASLKIEPRKTSGKR